MAVQKTPYGTWIARWTDPWGRQRSKTHKTKADADAHYRRVLGNMARGEYTDPKRGRVKLTQWADEWLAGARNLSRGGHDTYRRDLDRHILPALGKLPLGRVDVRQIDLYLTGKAETLAPSTVHRHYRTIHRMLEVARLRGLIARNPCEFVQPPTVPGKERPVLDPVQVDALADAISPRYRAWVYVMCWGGLRWGEAIGLRRKHITAGQAAYDNSREDSPDLSLITLRVVEQLVHRGPGEWERVAPKTGVTRSVTLPDFAAAELATHLETYSLPGPDGLVFPTRNGTPVQSPSFSANVFKRALRAARLPNLRIHDLRHTCVSLGIDAGINPKVNQARAGHASSAMHMDRYGHVYPPADAAAAVMLSEYRAKALRGRLKVV